jgi:2-hydroxy-6-oxonona-2,4-dienedioate hydrolase
MRVVRLALLLVAVGCLAVSGVTCRAYRRDLQEAEKRVMSGSRIAQTRCGPIEYASIGEGSPLLTVHGAGGGFDQALAFAPRLVDEEGLRGIFVSRFGYLRTPLPADASAEAQADAHACLLDALGIDRASVLGVSAGGPSALQFALRHPQRCSALILLVPAAFTPDDGGQRRTAPRATQFLDTVMRSDFAFWLAIHLARRSMIENVLGTPIDVANHASAAERQRLDMMLMNILPISRRRAGLLNDVAVVSTLKRPPLEQIKVPTLLISVEDDRYGTFRGARYTASQIPGARFVGYRDGGHLFVGHNEEVLTEIAAFLKTYGARGLPR